MRLNLLRATAKSTDSPYVSNPMGAATGEQKIKSIARKIRYTFGKIISIVVSRKIGLRATQFYLDFTTFATCK